jgi:hypothetical protein
LAETLELEGRNGGKGEEQATVSESGIVMRGLEYKHLVYGEVGVLVQA